MSDVLAILQNQWFKNPERTRQIYAEYPDQRRDLISAFLFMGCLTGKRLKAAFGDYVYEIEWEEASPEIGGRSSSVFPADPEHIQKAIEDVQPRVVLAFGKIATAGLREAVPSDRTDLTVITGPHPAARHATVRDELAGMAEAVRRELA